MKSSKQNYITFSAEGRLLAEDEPAVEPAPAPQVETEESSDVAYRLTRVAEEAARQEASPNALGASNVTEYLEKQVGTAPVPEEAEDSGEMRPRVLVMARGKIAKQLIQEAKDAGFSAWAPLTQERRFDLNLREADGTVVIGERYSDALFCNGYAVLEAALECGATTILLAGESLPLADVDIFLARASRRGVRVFRPMTDRAIGFGWVLCSTERTVPAEEEWRVCRHCGLTFDGAGLAAGHYICPQCGGYMLEKRPEEISLMDVINCTESTMAISRCLEKDGYGTGTAEERKEYHETVLGYGFSACCCIES